MKKLPKDYIIDIIHPNSPLIHAISKRGLFRTQVELYDVMDSQGKAVMVNKLLRANPQFQGKMKALQFLANNHYKELLLGTVSIPNKYLDDFLAAFKHEFNYLEIAQPDCLLVQAMHERQEKQQILSRLCSDERFVEGLDLRKRGV